MSRIIDYPWPGRDLIDSDPLAGWVDGQQVQVPTRALADRAVKAAVGATQPLVDQTSRLAIAASLSAATALTASNMYPDTAHGIAAVADGAYFVVAGDALNTYAILYRRQGTAAVEQTRYASKAAYEGPGGARLLGYGQRTVASKLSERLSICDYMTPEAIQAGVNRVRYDHTAAIQQCFDDAMARHLTVYIPGGSWGTRNLRFGSNNPTGPSDGPMGLVGESAVDAYLYALDGVTGTLIQAWGQSGRRFANFTLDANNQALKLIDWDYKGEIGPSTQNIIDNVRAINSTAPVVVSINDLNDTAPHKLCVTAANPSQCCIEAVQSGGMTWLANCSWTGGFLRIAAQNFVLLEPLGMGVEVVGGTYNAGILIGGQLYPNTAKGGHLWSNDFGGARGMAGLRCIGTYFIGNNANGATPASLVASWYTNLNIGSRLTFEDCIFIGGKIPLLGPQSHADNSGTIRVMVSGGESIANPVQFQEMLPSDMPGFAVICDSHKSSSSGAMVGKDWSGTYQPTLTGANNPSGATQYAQRMAAWTRTGNEIRLELELGWTSTGESGQLLVTGCPWTVYSPLDLGVAGHLGRCSAAFANARVQLQGSTIVIYGNDDTGFQIPATGTLRMQFVFPVTAN